MFDGFTDEIRAIDYQANGVTLARMDISGRDKNGNIGKEIRTQGTASVSKAYAYDGFDRLVSAPAPWNGQPVVDAYSYTLGGDLVQGATTSSGRELYKYQDTSVAHAVTGVTGGAGRTLAYDAAGRLSRQTVEGSATAFTWDGGNCMREAASSTAVKRQWCGVDGTRVVRNTDLGGALQSRTIPFLGLGEIKPDAASGTGVFAWRLPVNGQATIEESRSFTDGTMVGGPQSGFILTDGRGSVLAETDLQGAPQVVEAADYEAWGEANQVKAGMSLPEHGYVGAERDPAFGFYTYGVRVYDPSLRRWFSPEPEWLTQGPIGLNPYQYANNNPVRFVDLDGRVVVLPGNSPGVIAAHERGMAGSDSYRTRFNTLNDRQDVVVYVAASEIPPIRRRIAPDGEVLGNCTAVAGETEFGLINVAIDVKAARGPDDLFRTLMHEFGHAERDMPEALALRDAARLPNGSQERQQLEKWAKDRSTDAHTDQEHHNVRKEAEKATREVLDSEAKKKVNDSPAAKKAVSP